ISRSKTLGPGLNILIIHNLTLHSHLPSMSAILCRNSPFGKHVFDNGCLYHGHIQELTENEGPVLVFIEELGQKRSVPYQSLKPVPAKNNSQFVFYKNYRRRKDMPVSMTAVSKDYTPNMQVANYQQIVPPVSHQQQTDDSYKVNFFSSQTQGHPSGVRSFHMNNMQQVNSMDQAAISSQYPSSPSQQGPRNFSAPPLHHFMQYTSNIGSPVGMHPGYLPSVPIPPPVYTYICVPHLETIQVNQVNLNSQPSQDAMGKDLPRTDMNTLRFFYNLGVEHYRSLMAQTSMWPSSMDLQQITPDQMNGNICSGQFPQHFYQNFMQVNPSHITTVNTNTGPSSTSVSASALPCLNKDHLESKPLSVQLGSKVGVEEPSPGVSSGHSHSSDGDNATVGGDLCHDSGCDSDSMTCSASSHSDDSFKEEVEAEKSECEQCTCAHEENDKCESSRASESLIVREEDSESACESLSLAGEVVNHAVELEKCQQQINQHKPITRKKYYMYGNHKLVKPIKDIPPRFLSMLAETSAARAHCEGEPIIIPFLPPKPYGMHHYHPEMISGTVTNSSQPFTKFNPEAQCFIPSSAHSASLSPGNASNNVTSPAVHNGNGSDKMVSLVSPYGAVPTFSAMAEVLHPNPGMPTNSCCKVYIYNSAFSYNQSGHGVSKVEGHSTGIEACNSFCTNSSSSRNNASSGGGAYNVSCTHSHSSGTASQVTACSMSNYPTAACPPAAFYYSNQTFPTGAPQPCLPAPHGVSSGPGIAYFSGAQPFSLPPPPQMQMQSPAQASH
ncbi:hypothetical protein ACJMK2_032310, partial [Sinanodonta woodiana]